MGWGGGGVCLYVCVFFRNINKETVSISLNSLAVRVPHNFSSTSVAPADPESGAWPVAGRCWDWFSSKTNGFLTIAVAGSVKPMLF